jgi:hypothetical protein
LERSINDSIEGRENIETTGAINGQPGPGDDRYAEENWTDGVEGAESVGEEGRDDAERESGGGSISSGVGLLALASFVAYFIRTQHR